MSADRLGRRSEGTLLPIELTVIFYTLMPDCFYPIVVLQREQKTNILALFIPDRKTGSHLSCYSRALKKKPILTRKWPYACHEILSCWNAHGPPSLGGGPR